MQNYFGEIAGLLTAVFWTVTSMAFESAGKKVGSLAVNLIRLVIAFFLYWHLQLDIPRVFLSNRCHRLSMAVAGIIGARGFCHWRPDAVPGPCGGRRKGFHACDVARTTFCRTGRMACPGEVLTPMNWLGMTVTIAGIVLVILKREKSELNGSIKNRLKSSYSLPGLVMALGGAIGQATGLVLSKKGMGSYDAFSSSQIRVLTGIAGFSILFIFMKRWTRVWAALKNPPAMRRITLGAFFGPFLGRIIFASCRSAYRNRHCRHPDVDCTGAHYYPFCINIPRKNQPEGNYWCNYYCGRCSHVLPVVLYKTDLSAGHGLNGKVTFKL
jgi:drug/metabolite transporter (DMT)-like permease